jgi:hypothetical protein
MHEGSSSPGVGGFKSYMSDNSDSDDSAKFQAFYFIRSKIPCSPVLLELSRKGNAKCLYWRNLNDISDSDYMPIPMLVRSHCKCVLRDRCLKLINASAAGFAYTGQAYDSPNSKDVTEVEYATEWYS